MVRPAERIVYGEPRSKGSVPFWRMPTIWAAAEGKPVTRVAIASLDLLDEVVWFGGPKNEPTVRRVAEHAHDIFSADLAFPIIMTRAGELLDGAHRIAKAYLAGQSEIAAVQINGWPPPDGFVDPPKPDGT